MLKKILLCLILITATSCSEDEDKDNTVVKYINCTEALENKGECIRFMDRKIYLAYSSGTNPSKNNEFQKSKIIEALQEIGAGTNLGSTYFQTEEINEAFLNPIIEPGLEYSEYRSFIQVWPDNEFNDLVVNVLGGNVPDANAVTVINSAYKRKFYIIMRASCFDTQATCGSITSNGLKALLARQFGFLLGLTPANCTTLPTSVMCVNPSDDQWGIENNKNQYFNDINNSLESIKNNPNYYDEFIPGA